MYGVEITFRRAQKGCSVGSGSWSNASSAAPAIECDWRTLCLINTSRGPIVDGSRLHERKLCGPDEAPGASDPG
jgi:hypothetical protein